MLQVEYEEGKQLVSRCVCTYCGGELTLAWGGSFGIDHWVLRCGNTPDHKGIISRPLPQGRKEGKTPIEITVDNPQLLSSLVMARWGSEGFTYPAVLLFTYQVLRMGLDPLDGEVYPMMVSNEKTGKMTIIPIITEKGYGCLAARACPEGWNGPPAAAPVTDPLLSKLITDTKTAWLWQATGRRKDWDPGREYKAYGWVTKWQWLEARRNRQPAGSFPSNQARIRAIKRWYQEVYPESTSRLRQASGHLIQDAQGVEEALKLIEAEYGVVGNHIQAEVPYKV